MKLIMFGTGATGREIYENHYRDQDVVAWADNNSSRWGTALYNIPICEPEQCLLEMEYDKVIIASAGGFYSVLQQCLDMGIPEEKLVTWHIEGFLKPRRTFLASLASVLNEYEQEAAVAEGGVYEGDFASWINTCFPNRTLHLFDTFEGFDERDIPMEVENGFSGAAAGHLSRTSVELVMGKMAHPQLCRVHQGYFPDSAAGVTGKFCFVNLDFDLYNPTYSGLCFFRDKMTDNGVILVHDYFGGYKGVRAAVDRFILECGGSLGKYPIGDGVSIMIAGKWS